MNLTLYSTPESIERVDFNTLKNFSANKANSTKAPKKEYLRCKLIRGHKRAIRQINKGILPKATLNKFDKRDTKSIEI